ncbi:MAG: hypothetical protein AB7F50_11780 [Fimbriimonadaceae bacterium]
MPDIGVLIPIVAIVFPMLVAIVSILVRHQQKMAELIHNQPRNQAADSEVSQMRRELAAVNDRLNQVLLAFESKSSSAPERIEERLGGPSSNI